MKKKIAGLVLLLAVMAVVGIVFLVQGQQRDTTEVTGYLGGEKIGLLESNAFVQGTAFALSLLAMWFFGKGNLKGLLEVNKAYWLGGVLGLAITLTVMLAIKGLSPTVAISIILIAQLLVAALIDAFGWLGTEKVGFHFTKYLGLLLMIGGVVLFKLKS